MPHVAMPQVDVLRETFPDTAKDTRLNLSTIAASEVLDADQIWGIALASAYYIGEPRLRDALLADAKTAGVGDAVLDDAQTAATLMGMNTVYYRFRHLVGKESYGTKQPRLRMQGMAKPKTGKAAFELMSLAIAVLAGCETCVKAHESSVLHHGLGEEHVHDTVRIAAILQGAAVAVRLA